MVNGIGARQKALAGAGVASSTDATAASLNPAGLVNVQSQINAAVSFLYLNGGFSTSGTGGLDPDGHHDSDRAGSSFPTLPRPGGSIGALSTPSPSRLTATAVSTPATRTSSTATAPFRA